MQSLFRDKKIRWFALLALLLLLVWLFHTDKNSVIRIGVLHSLSGTMAASETPLVDAIRLAVEEANQAGGINGAEIEMIVSDCRSDAAYCAQQAEKLITQDKVQALFGCWTSDCRKAVRTVVEQHHILLFYPVQYEGLEHSHDIIYTGAVPSQQIVPMVSWALQQQGKRVYLIGSDYVYPHIANRIVKMQLQALGGELLAERYVPLGGKDMQQVAREIATLQPDFVVNTLNGGSNLYFFQALKKAGVRAEDTAVFSTSIAEVELAAIGSELVAGHYSAWSYFQSVERAENRDFIKRFQKRFGAQRVLDDPMEAAYIGVNLWVSALRHAKTLDHATVKNILGQMVLAAPGGRVSVDAATGHLWKRVRIARARADGQFDIVWESRRSIAPAPFPFFIAVDELRAMQDGRP